MPEEKFSNLIESVKKFFNSVYGDGEFITAVSPVK